MKVIVFVIQGVALGAVMAADLKSREFTTSGYLSTIVVALCFGASLGVWFEEKIRKL